MQRRCAAIWARFRGIPHGFRNSPRKVQNSRWIQEPVRNSAKPDQKGVILWGFGPKGAEFRKGEQPCCLGAASVCFCSFFVTFGQVLEHFSALFGSVLQIGVPVGHKNLGNDYFDHARHHGAHSDGLIAWYLQLLVIFVKFWSIFCTFRFRSPKWRVRWP